MNVQSGLQGKDWGAFFWIVMTQALTAWIMAFIDLVYAPIPMFAAAIVAGLYFRGRPRAASLAGAMAGLVGGIAAEWAFHVVRVQNRIMNWAQMESAEQLGLAIAELFLYASLLSFFAAFFSWGTAKEPPVLSSVDELTTDNRIEPLYSPAEKEIPQVDIPIFKPEDEGKSSE
ncbi:hypothetical protein K8S19_00575 [bacterium]|nr:hypothetical protein [bacterium]